MIYSKIDKIYHVCQVKDEIKIKQYHIYDKCYIYNIIVYDNTRTSEVSTTMLLAHQMAVLASDCQSQGHTRATKW